MPKPKPEEIMNRRTVLSLMIMALFLFLETQALAEDDASLVVHEWGTITTKHYTNGRIASGMNVVEKTEILPEFVHRTKDDVLRALDKSSKPTDAHPDVTMRLETPVIYFYPSESFDKAKPIQVSVEFQGGLLNEFYPDAVASYEGIKFEQRKGADRAEETRLTKYTRSGLVWKDLSLGGQWPGPTTNAVVWTAPRQVNAVDIRARNGESERYLFYRGVGRLHSPIRTRHDPKAGQIVLLDSTDCAILDESSVTIPALWMVWGDKSGRIAFEEFGPLTLTTDQDQILAKLAVGSRSTPYNAENVGVLRNSMHQALISNGLFADEAEAMLNTWKHAYFNAKGTRILFIVPSVWVDYHLSLSISVPAEVVRVYLGRVDLAGF